MPILMSLRGSLMCPIIYCDDCGQSIETPFGGVYAWKGGAETSDGKFHAFSETLQPIHFFHHDCFQRTTVEPDGTEIVWGAIKLACLPLLLRNNLHLTAKQAERELEALALVP